MVEIIDGAKMAAEVKEELKPRIAALKKAGLPPGLAVILVGNDPASESYVRGKGRAAEELGIFSQTITLSESVGETDLFRSIDCVQADPRIHGLLVQTPLPSHISEDSVILHIDPEKDVDGATPINVGKMLIGIPGLLPCTPHGIQEMLVRSGNSPEGKHVVIVGRSNIVGKPIAAILVQKAKGANATVTVCHSGTPNLSEMTRQADILIAAMGRPRFIKADMVREGVVVIDVGVNRVEDPSAKRGYRLVGDVDFEPVAAKAKAITPVPGGVGPMTIAMLMQNTVEAAEAHLKLHEAAARALGHA